MDNRAALGVAALIGLGVVVGIAGILIGIGSGVHGVDGVLDDERTEPTLLSFGATNPQCADDLVVNSSTAVVAGDGTTEITHARNVSLPGPSYGLGNATFRPVNDSTYALSVPIEAKNGSDRECPGVVRYKGTMRIPSSDEPWSVIVTHNNETVTTITGQSDSSASGGSVQVGQSVSAESPQNTTESTE